MNTFTFDKHESHWTSAWTREEIHLALSNLIDRIQHRLPNLEAQIVIKPNLNNDLNALTGNSVDLRVLDALIRILKNKGYHRLCIADGPNVGIERRGIDVFKRLGVTQLCSHHNVKVTDLNADLGTEINLSKDSKPRISKTILDADYVICLPKIKTHCEALLSCAMKNWVGICVGQDKRQMHNNLGLNIASLNAHVPADLVIVDGIIGMEGNGPGDGTPIALKQIIVSSGSHLNDVVVSRLLNIEPMSIPYLAEAIKRNDINRELLEQVSSDVQPLTNIERPPDRPRLAVLSEHPLLKPLKMAMRPLTAQPEVLDLAYQFGIVQDVYHPLDAEVHSLKRSAEPCGTCTRCSDLCPTGIPLDKISSDHEDCLSCLQCWWACPTDHLEWHGVRGHLHRHISKYRDSIKALFDSVEAS